MLFFIFPDIPSFFNHFSFNLLSYLNPFLALCFLIGHFSWMWDTKCITAGILRFGVEKEVFFFSLRPSSHTPFLCLWEGQKREGMFLL